MRGSAVRSTMLRVGWLRKNTTKSRIEYPPLSSFRLTIFLPCQSSGRGSCFLFVYLCWFAHANKRDDRKESWQKMPTWYQGDRINVGEGTPKLARCAFWRWGNKTVTRAGFMGTMKYSNRCCTSYQRGMCKPRIALESVDTTNTENLGRTLAMDSRL